MPRIVLISTLETASHLFQQLREKKIAASDRRQVRVYDIGRLRAMVEL